VGAVAADGVAVDNEHVRQQLRAGAVRVGAFRPVQPMLDERAVAVLQALPAVAAAATVLAHGLFVAPRADTVTVPRPSGPAEFVQPHVVDAEVVGDLVDHGDLHFLDDVLLVVAEVQQRVPVDRDGVRQ